MPTQFSLKRLIICTFQKIKPTQSLHYAYTIYVLFDLKHAEKKDLPYEGTKKSAQDCNFFD